jgi:citrate lyase beta subunit/acyl dehydratase
MSMAHHFRPSLVPRRCHHQPLLLLPRRPQHRIFFAPSPSLILVGRPPCRPRAFSSPHASGDDEAWRTRQRQRPRRSVHFVPADNDRYLNKSLSLGADTVVYDLEDSVRDKVRGREVLRSFLLDRSRATTTHDDGMATSSHSTPMPEVLVRINPLSGDHWRDDLLASFDGADGYVVPKVETREELFMLDGVLSELERGEEDVIASASSLSSSRRRHRRPRVLLPIATETPSAVLNIGDIARGPRVIAITWGCEDLSAELGGTCTRIDENDGYSAYLDVYRHCRTMCLLAARAANVQAIDGIYQNVRDVSGFGKEAHDAMRMGYDGKLTLHPDQIRGANDAFVPSVEDVEKAHRIVTMWEDGMENGEDGTRRKGSMEYEGKMIDLPHYVRAKKVIARGEACGVRRQRDDDAVVVAQVGVGATYSNVVAGVGGVEMTGGTSATAAAGGRTETTPFPRICHGKYLEDLHPGLKVMHYLTRTVTESDNVFFTCLTLNPAPIHLDHELSRENADALLGGDSSTAALASAGRPLFNSMFTLALLVGMSVPECTHGTTVANLGFSEVSFPKPVYPGDTLRAETEVLDRRESKSRPNQGIVVFRHVAFNQRGEEVCRATRQALMKKRP